MLRAATTDKRLVHVRGPVDATPIQVIEFLDEHGFFKIDRHGLSVGRAPEGPTHACDHGTAARI